MDDPHFSLNAANEKWNLNLGSFVNSFYCGLESECETSLADRRILNVGVKKTAWNSIFMPFRAPDRTSDLGRNERMRLEEKILSCERVNLILFITFHSHSFSLVHLSRLFDRASSLIIPCVLYRSHYHIPRDSADSKARQSCRVPEPLLPRGFLI